MGARLAHSGSVRRIADGRAFVAVATAGCSSCGHGGSCGIGKIAGNRRESLVAVPAEGLRIGQRVTLELDEAQLTRAALFGYFLPALLLIIGALLGESFGAKVDAGSTLSMPDAANTYAALGALAGLFVGILLGRLRAPLMPRLVVPATTVSMFPQEKHHV